MLNRSASLAMSTCVLKTLPGKLDIKRHSPSILYLLAKLSTLVNITAVKLSMGTSVSCSAISLSVSQMRIE